MDPIQEYLPVSRHDLGDGSVLSFVGDRSTLRHGGVTVRLSIEETNDMLARIARAGLREAVTVAAGQAGPRVSIVPSVAATLLWDHYGRRRFCGGPEACESGLRFTVQPDQDVLDWPRSVPSEGTAMALTASVGEDGTPFISWEAGPTSGLRELILEPAELAALGTEVATALSGGAATRIAPLRTTREIFTFETGGARCRVRRHDLERLGSWLADPRE